MNGGGGGTEAVENFEKPYNFSAFFVVNQLFYYILQPTAIWDIPLFGRLLNLENLSWLKRPS
jgi:hypothetical protein